jgi:hypothetical protein
MGHLAVVCSAQCLGSRERSSSHLAAQWLAIVWAIHKGSLCLDGAAALVFYQQVST